MGFTTLHLAAREGFLDMCKLLISKGIDDNIRDYYGFSASYWAMQNGHKEVIELLPNPLKRSKEEYFANLKVL
tara:strand:- start:155 stop:373 length:219 start_codon:yes stop_codon:yes gene_type:complete